MIVTRSAGPLDMARVHGCELRWWVCTGIGQVAHDYEVPCPTVL